MANSRRRVLRGVGLNDLRRHPALFPGGELMCPLFNWGLFYAFSLVLVSLVMIILRQYLLGMKILFTAVTLVLSLAPVAVLPLTPTTLVYSISFAVFWYLNLCVVSFLRSGRKVRRREMFDGWND